MGTGAEAKGRDPDDGGLSVGGVATLYLGNILYALERCALALEGEDRPVDAAFYRGIGRKLAEAHGAAKAERGSGQADA